MKICSTCGAPVGDKIDVCPYCGSTIPCNEADADYDKEDYEDNNEEKIEEPPISKKATIPTQNYIIMIILITLIMIVGSHC